MDKARQDRIKENFEQLYQAGITPWKDHPHERLLTRFFSLVKAHFPEAKLLDAGCGDGWISIEAARLGFDVWGIDSSTTAIDRARQSAKLAKLEHKVHFSVADVLTLTFQPQYFDAIIDRGLFHHIVPGNRSLYLKNILKVLKVHALVYLAVFSMNNPPQIGQRFEKQDIVKLFGPYFEMLEFSEDSAAVETPAHLYHFILRKK